MWLARETELCLLNCSTTKVISSLFHKLDISVFQSIAIKLPYQLGGDLQLGQG